MTTEKGKKYPDLDVDFIPHFDFDLPDLELADWWKELEEISQTALEIWKKEHKWMDKVLKDYYREQDDLLKACTWP